MTLHKITVLATVAIPTALCLWWSGLLVGQFFAQIASLYEIQAMLKRDAVLTILQGI
ncbi:hypothetical protein [Sinorhizobium fredii]|uniref:hypothetical protein n=1 Tax=Rhizobium fredii TaxID=380 RepID=UPI000725189B|nr:hypothetical protein [Sinorhizobium fredii]KSV80779.1 hypothetical protein N181_07220 [Sinorhizobium fredii USDA 205]GEC30313.1 hypothetical protein EFR01_04840 [Sinorhizobium fredii]GLS09892.1 hypothetical protein GCM10007864_35230 [Sinorhizobium fredii]